MQWLLEAIGNAIGEWVLYRYLGGLALPVAVAVGAAIAAKPALQLVTALLPLLNVLPAELASAPMQFLPQLQIIVLGGMAFAAGITLIKMLEET